MGRPREFDEQAVLSAATEAFWRDGFEAVPTRRLAACMGLSVASLYNAFGDKQGLYRRVLETYAAEAVADCAQRLSEGEARGAIEGLFLEWARAAPSDAGRRGCLVVNAGLEQGPHDPELRALVGGVFASLEGLFRAAARRGQAAGSISRAASADDLGRQLLGLMLGLRVMARSGAAPDMMLGLAHSVSAMLEPRAA